MKVVSCLFLLNVGDEKNYYRRWAKIVNHTKYRPDGMFQNYGGLLDLTSWRRYAIAVGGLATRYVC